MTALHLAGVPGCPGRTGVGRLVRSPAGPPLLAATLAAAAWSAGLHGTDEAAQVFQVMQVRQHGLALINSAWYGGTYPLSYSVAVGVLGAAVGLIATSVFMSAAATWAFDRLMTGYLGRRSAGSWYFAASTLLQVAIGQVPFLCGEALGLLALVALTSRRRWPALALGVASALCSPLAAAFLALAALAWTLRSWPRRSLAAVGPGWWPVVVALGCGVVVAAVSVAFPGDGPFPFPWTELVVVELLCSAVLSPLVRTTPAVRLAVAMYAVASLASFVVPNPLGGNAGRLASAIGVPLLACFATAHPGARLGVAARLGSGRVAAFEQRWRRYAAVVVIPFAVWQWAPGLSAVRPAHDAAATTAAFYSPLLHRLAGVAPSLGRIEVVPTADHWESVYVATPSLSLARGWERQIDTARNPIFYRPGALTPASYRQWLLSQGVTWVALPRVPVSQLDYAGVGEAALLHSGRTPGLEPAWHDADWTLWRVEGSPGLVSGPATLRAVDADTVDLDATAPGVVVLRLHWTPYWSIPPASGCLAPTPSGWTQLRLSGAGPVTLHAALAPGRGPDCAAPLP